VRRSISDAPWRILVIHVAPSGETVAILNTVLAANPDGVISNTFAAIYSTINDLLGRMSFSFNTLRSIECAKVPGGFGNENKCLENRLKIAIGRPE
jgi:hypothetical protein